MEKYKSELIEITDLKDMLNKTGKIYGEKTAYKIKVKDNNDNKYKIFTHREIREMINNLRNSFDRYGN